MNASITRLKQFALGAIAITFTAIPFHLLWDSHPFERAQSETSREIIAAMISAHGGMEKWRLAPTVSFEDHFRPAGAATATASRVTVEQELRRAYLDFPGATTRLSWDGKQAWSENWQAPFPPRFLALLNYYFLNLPWLTMDSGVILGEPGKAKLWDDPTEYITIEMTFAAGVGDTPDDYYVLYIDPKSHRLEACEYIVTYAALLPSGVTATPPHILVTKSSQQLMALWFPRAIRSMRRITHFTPPVKFVTGRSKSRLTLHA